MKPDHGSHGPGIVNPEKKFDILRSRFDLPPGSRGVRAGARRVGHSAASACRAFYASMGLSGACHHAILGTMCGRQQVPN